jgi:alkylation response protein AidB-like acyl-CoA dehydrogenase
MFTVDSVPTGGLGPYSTDEREALQQMARQFAMQEVLPIANELDHTGEYMPKSLIKKMGEVGFFSLKVPEEYGGLGLGMFEYCLVTEELSRAWMSVASIIARATELPTCLGEDFLRDRYPRMMAGEYLGATALSEPDAGSDLGGISCRARRDGDDWIIDGQKMWCTNADQASFLHVLARTAPPEGPRRHVGISEFFIEKESGTFPQGVTGSALPTIGYHGWRSFELSFDGCRVPGSALIRNGDAFADVADRLSGARVHTAARAVGLARGALEDSIAYVQQREQFGKPIGEFQAIRFKIAWMASQIEAARQLTYFAASQIDRGLGRQCQREASMAKLIATEMAERVTSEAIQIHGGYGYTTEFAVERHWRDARLTKIIEGTSEIQHVIISDLILGRSRQ